MGTVIHGTIPTRTRVRQVIDSASGNSWEHEWVGSIAGIASLAATLVAAGARVRDESANGVGRLIATYSVDPDNPSAEEAVDRYEFEMEPVQVSLFNHPAVALESDGYVNQSQYKSDIEEAVSSGAALTLSATEYPLAHEVYRLLSRGVEAYEIKRPVLSRVRAFSPNFSGRVVLSAVETVYTTAALVRDFAIPATVASQLPANPPETPEGTTWAWKLRGDRSVFIPAQNRIEETRDWVFASWSTLLYTVTV
jgi:hypothetical protein